MHLHTRHTFPQDASWAPERIEINGRKGRRVVCVIAQDKIHYRIFDLDTPIDGDNMDNEATDGMDA
jgi:anaphase-promoting complex subunit 4